MKTLVFRLHMTSLIALLCLATSPGCSGDKQSTRPQPKAAKPEKPTSSPAPKDTGTGHPVEPPAPVPAAYFGDLGLDRLTEPLDIEPIPQGNIALIVADALNVQHAGIYGYERETTPNIDAIAKRGVVLTNYVSNSSWTRPSFTTLLTGLTKRQHQMELNVGPLKRSLTTLAERFDELGYRTGAFIGNPLIREQWGFAQGFDRFDDIIAMGTKGYPPDRRLVERAIKWIERKKEEPFFVVFFLTAPHPPYRPPSEPRTFLSQVPDGKILEHPFKEYEKPLPKDVHDRIVAAYDDETAYMDAQVGRFVEFLQRAGLREKTALVITADHGELFGEHNSYLHAYHMWEPALRVQAILEAPGLPRRGVYDDRPFTHIDWAPTLFDLVRRDPGENEFEGVSIVKALADRTLVPNDRILFSQYNAHGVRREAIRKGRYKLVHRHKVEPRAERQLDELHPSVHQADPKDLPSLNWNEERWELYDLEADPRELTDLYPSMKGSPIVAELKVVLGREIGDTALSSPELSEEMREALKNAGYIRD